MTKIDDFHIMFHSPTFPNACIHKSTYKPILVKQDRNKCLKSCKTTYGSQREEKNKGGKTEICTLELQ